MILDGNDPSAIATAARALRSGALLGLPTETVYGLAADASSDAAVAQIFAAKGRPSDHPLIVHVADAAGIAHFASEVPAFAQKLVDAFWPGPLTVWACAARPTRWRTRCWWPAPRQAMRPCPVMPPCGAWPRPAPTALAA